MGAPNRRGDEGSQSNNVGDDTEWMMWRQLDLLVVPGVANADLDRLVAFGVSAKPSSPLARYWCIGA